MELSQERRSQLIELADQADIALEGSGELANEADAVLSSLANLVHEYLGNRPELPTELGEAERFAQEVAQNCIVREDFTEGNEVFNEVVRGARKVCGELSITFEPGELPEDA